MNELLKWLFSYFIPKKKTAKKIAGATAGVVALAVSMIQPFEGLRLQTYFDATGTATVCYGETLNVKPGMRFTQKQCEQKLIERVGHDFYDKMKPMIKVDVPPLTMASFVSFTYNVGLGNFKSSTLLKKLNRGDYVGACNELPKWNKSKGIVLKGLITRRAKEKQMCLEGLK